MENDISISRRSIHGHGSSKNTSCPSCPIEIPGAVHRALTPNRMARGESRTPRKSPFILFRFRPDTFVMWSFTPGLPTAWIGRWVRSLSIRRRRARDRAAFDGSEALSERAARGVSAFYRTLSTFNRSRSTPPLASTRRKSLSCSQGHRRTQRRRHRRYGL